MDVSQLIQQKLDESGLEQRDLANAAEVTESYISQLLSRKKMPPAPDRTDIYDKLGRFLKLPAGKLAGLADVQRKQELKKKIQSPPVPLFSEVRELLLEKCKRDKRRQVRAIVEREPFGELERLITQKILDVVKAVAREELKRSSGSWFGRAVEVISKCEHCRIRIDAHEERIEVGGKTYHADCYSNLSSATPKPKGNEHAVDFRA